MFSQSIFNNWTIAEISKNETALVYIFLKRRYIASWKFYWAKVSLKKCECNSWRHLIYRSEFRWFLKNSIRTIEEFQCHLQNSNWKSFKTTAFGVFSTFLVRNMQTAAEFSKDHFTGFVRQTEFSLIFVWKMKIFWVCFDFEENKIECRCQFCCVLEKIGWIIEIE